MMAVFPCTIVLSDGRACVLREPVEEDAAALAAFVRRVDEESDCLSRFPGEFRVSDDEERVFIRDCVASPCDLMVLGVCDGAIIAGAKVTGSALRRYGHHAELGLAVRQDFWGLGLGREMTEQTIQWARSLGLRKLCLKVFADNERALCLYRSLGFQEEGCLRDDALRADGRYGDTLIMARFLTS